MLLTRILVILGIATCNTGAVGRTINHDPTKTSSTLAPSQLRNTGTTTTGTAAVNRPDTAVAKADGGETNHSSAFDRVRRNPGRSSLTRIGHTVRGEAACSTSTRRRASLDVGQIRGGGTRSSAKHAEHALSIPLLHHRQPPVNRRAVPPDEALSRYPSFKTPGGLVRLLDYVGTVSFAMSGAATAGLRGMNLLGCLTVGTLAATGGGTARDLFMGNLPVFWLVEVEYVGICIATALATFILWPVLSRVSVLSHMGTGMDGWLSQAVDTVGLASFCVAGTQHGIRKGFHPLMTIVICCITCSGGGIMRDILTSSPVLVLSAHAQMYVSTTAFGSAAYLLARRWSRDPLVRISVGFFCVIILRVLASVYNLRLPTMV